MRQHSRIYKCKTRVLKVSRQKNNAIHVLPSDRKIMYIVLMINQETRSLRCKKGSHPSSWSTRYRQYRIHLVVIHLSGSTLPWTWSP
jgi:hypothetical protein